MSPPLEQRPEQTPEQQGSDFWIPVYIGLGSNLDDPARQIDRAVAALAELPRTRCIGRAGAFRSRPMGPVEQPDFLNAAVGLLTQLSPQAFLSELKALERKLGRTLPAVRWGPRVIDLDLLVYGGVQLEEAELTLPHPGIQDRNFVLMPLMELAPDLDIPGRGRVSRLAAAVTRAGIERLPTSAAAHRRAS